MDKAQLAALLAAFRQDGKKTAVAFCSHVPLELLEAAGLSAVRLTAVEGLAPIAGGALPDNLCPMVKNAYDLCEGGDSPLREADLIVAESSCDGKKKMYELLSRQEQLWYYQIPQGTDRTYARPLMLSEFRCLAQELRRRFGAEVSDEALRQAAREANAERESVCSLLAVQQSQPPAAWGTELFAALEQSRLLPRRSERIAALRAAAAAFAKRRSPVPAAARRVLITGCPLGGVYRKVLDAVESSGGAAVCFETCDAVKSARRHVDPDAPDIWGALADAYLDTGCAIMSPDHVRLASLRQLAREYRADGILDVTLNTCHPYSVERDVLRRRCQEWGIPYLAVETGDDEADAGQLSVRIAAFLEMLD